MKISLVLLLSHGFSSFFAIVIPSGCVALRTFAELRVLQISRPILLLRTRRRGEGNFTLFYRSAIGGFLQVEAIFFSMLNTGERSFFLHFSPLFLRDKDTAYMWDHRIHFPLSIHFPLARARLARALLLRSAGILLLLFPIPPKFMWLHKLSGSSSRWVPSPSQFYWILVCFLLVVVRTRIPVCFYFSEFHRANPVK